MIKKFIGTKFLSGVSAVAVAVSGITAVSTASVSAAIEFPDAYQSAMMSINEIYDSVNNALEGNSEFAYNANINLKMNDPNISLKPIDISGQIRQKDKKSAADINVKYDSKSAITLNTVYDHQNETTYMKIPEINNGYLSFKNDESVYFLDLINAFFPDDPNDGYIEEEDPVNNDYPNADETNTDSEPNTTAAEIDIIQIIQAVESLDPEVLEQEIRSYLEIIESKLPVSNGANLEGELNGHNYNYTSLVYTITGQDFQNVVNAIAEKAKNDDLLKDLAVQFGISEEMYMTAIDEMVASINDMRPSELEEKTVVTVYMNGDEVTGIAVDNDLKMIMVTDGNFIGFDTMNVEYYDDEWSETITNKGWITADGNKFSGYFETVNTDSIDGPYLTESTTLNNVSFENGLSGEIKTRSEYAYDDVSQVTEKIMTSDCTADKLNVVYTESEDGVEVISATLTGKRVEPDDIEIPTENVYSLANEDDIVKYVASSDLSGFMANLKNVLGEDLFNEWFATIPDDSEPDNPDNNDSVIISESKNDDSQNDKVTTSSKSDSNKNPNNNSDNDKSPNTSAAGVSVVGIALAGLAVVLSKRK